MRFVIVLTFSAAAMAQTVSVSGSGAGGSFASSTGWFFSSAGSDGPGGQATGAPYSAEETSERVQTLADGTHITESQGSVKLYRDSSGRTRTERTLPVPRGAGTFTPPTIVEIFDPVAGVHYRLDEGSRTAHKTSVRMAPPPPPPPPNSASIRATRVVRLLPARIGAAGAADNDALRPQTTRESLGTQTIEGVMAEGTRTTTTYPIGSIGNDRPITTTNEVWMSPELRMTVLTKNSDPRSGDSTTRMTNISRADPDPSLFQVPADYQVVDNDQPEQRQ